MKGWLLRVIAPGVPLLAVLLWQVAETQRAHDMQVTQAMTAQLAESIDAEFALLAHELDMFAYLPSIQDGDIPRITRDAEQVSLYLRGWLSLVQHDTGQHATVAPKGQSVATDDEAQARPGGDLADLNSNRASASAAERNRVVVSDVHLGAEMELSVFTLSKRLSDETLPTHNLVLTVAASRLSQKLSDLPLPPAAVAAIVDSSGQLIGGGADVPMPQLTEIPQGFAEQLAAQRQGSTNSDVAGFGSPKSVTGWESLSNAPGWAVVVSLPNGQPGAAYGSLAVPAALVLLSLILLVGRHSVIGRLERASDAQAATPMDAITPLVQDVETLRRDAALRDEQVSMLSHDMRTALLGTQDLIQRITVASRDPGQTFHLNAALAATGRMLRMIDPQMMGPEAGARSLSRLEAFSPYTLLASLPPLIEGPAQKNGTRLSVDLASNMPWLLGDATQIGQIVLNLLGNAAKFTRNGAVYLAAQVEPMPDASQRGRLVITVTDTGPGIDPDELSKIFTSRFRGAQQADQQIEGSGLGLSIVKRLVDAMQGNIAVNSVVGQGSMFTLTLPLELALPVERREPAAASDLLTGRRVLLVDDDPNMLLAGSKVLQRAGAQVRLANTAEDALAACQDTSPDAFVLDLNIPGVDVAELVRAIRRLPKLQGRPIIAFSGKMDAQRVAECRAMGFDAAIQKDADLSQAVSDVLLAA
jgi:signal transduction histidine kinase